MVTIHEARVAEGYELFQKLSQELGHLPDPGDCFLRGLQMGRVIGRREMLLQQIGLVWGNPGVETIERVYEASADELYDWAGALLVARSPDKVFVSKDPTPPGYRRDNPLQDIDDRFVAEGFAAGGEEGCVKGKAEMLLKLLRLKFGRLPARVRKEVNAASAQQLDAWAETLFAGPSLEDVFAA